MVNNDDALFQSILSEGQTSSKTHFKSDNKNRSRRQTSKIVLPDSSLAPDIMFTSSVEAPPQEETTLMDDIDADFEDEMRAAETIQEKSFLSSDDLTPEELQQRILSNLPQSRPPLNRKFLGFRFSGDGKSFQERIQEKDYNGIITNYFVPLTFLGVGTVWSTRKVIEKYNNKMESTLSAYANEMVYHDGDFEEMQMCHNDYKKRLVTLGPRKKSSMLNSYLEIFSKKKAVSPQAISSLSYVFSMYKLSEENAAKALVSVAKDSLTDKLASAGKLLFFGERILSSPGGQLALQPIREMLENSYRAGGKQIVATSQRTMGESAYRSCISAAGKDQTELTPGWEVLGLTQETAETIFSEVAEVGFKSKRELQYGGVRQKYDDKGRKIDDGGNLLDPSEGEDDDGGNDSPSGGSGNVYECTECGYTLFPAAGREFKFFPDSFKCPECGAAKDKFKAR